MSVKKRSLASTAMLYSAYALIVVAFGLPILFMILTGLHVGPSQQAGSSRPPALSLENYAHLFATFPVGRYSQNSVLIAGASTALGLALGTPAAYGIVRSGRRALALIPLAIRMMPGILFLLPLVMLSLWLGGEGTLLNRTILVVAHTVVTLPLCIWLILPSVSQLPVEVEEAAMLDGADSARRFLWIVLPLLRPALVVAALSSFLYSWNYFLFGLAIATEETMPLTVMAFRFVGQGTNDFGGLMAASTLIAAPSLLLGTIADKWMIRGVTDGMF